MPQYEITAARTQEQRPSRLRHRRGRQGPSLGTATSAAAVDRSGSPSDGIDKVNKKPSDKASAVVATWLDDPVPAPVGGGGAMPQPAFAPYVSRAAPPPPSTPRVDSSLSTSLGYARVAAMVTPPSPTSPSTTRPGRRTIAAGLGTTLVPAGTAMPPGQASAEIPVEGPVVTRLGLGATDAAAPSVLLAAIMEQGTADGGGAAWAAMPAEFGPMTIQPAEGPPDVTKEQPGTDAPSPEAAPAEDQPEPAQRQQPAGVWPGYVGGWPGPYYMPFPGSVGMGYPSYSPFDMQGGGHYAWMPLPPDDVAMQQWMLMQQQQQEAAAATLLAHIAAYSGAAGGTPTPPSPPEAFDEEEVPSSARIDMTLFRSKLCLFWLEGPAGDRDSGCPYGVRCLYAHGEEQLQRPNRSTTSKRKGRRQGEGRDDRHRKPVRQMCHDWLMGRGAAGSCPAGQACPYKHPEIAPREATGDTEAQ
jgi:hypothetical protein